MRQVKPRDNTLETGLTRNSGDTVPLNKLSLNSKCSVMMSCNFVKPDIHTISSFKPLLLQAVFCITSAVSSALVDLLQYTCSRIFPF
jgi:hypothetical protein